MIRHRLRARLKPIAGILRRAVSPDRVPDALLLVSRYVLQHRRLPNLIRPRRFTDKILYRILFDRRPRLGVMADKFGVRSYVRDRLGESFLPDLLHVTPDPRDIPFDRLPDRFVIKPTHGCNWVRIVRDKSALDRAAVIAECQGWLDQDYYRITREWAYSQVTPQIVIEELIDDGNNLAPNDYKLFVYDGRTEFILVIVGRFVKKAHIVMTPEWTPVAVSWPACGERVAVPRPVHLRQMLQAAQRLARDLDFARVDFYDTGDRLYFGEMTATPGCGTQRFDPPSFDFDLGAPWTLQTARSAANAQAARPAGLLERDDLGR